MREAFVNSLVDLASKDKNIVLLTADLGFGVFERFEQLYPDQFYNVGIAEQNMVGVGTGLALEGKKVVIYSIGNFPTLRCLEQIRNDACYHEINMTIISSGGGYSYGALGYSHHATEDLSIMRAIPNMKVIAPCSKWESGQAIEALINDNSVSYLRLDKTAANDDQIKKNNFNILTSRRYKEGSDISLIATGGILKEALKAAIILEKKSISCRVIAMHTVKPLDNLEIDAAIMETNGIVTIEENNIIGGLGSAISEYCMNASKIPKKFLSIGINDRYSSIVGSQDYLRTHNNLDSESIATNVISLLNR